MSFGFAGTVAEKSRDREKIIDNKRFTCYYNVCKITQGMSEFMLSEVQSAQGVGRRQIDVTGQLPFCGTGMILGVLSFRVALKSNPKVVEQENITNETPPIGEQNAANFPDQRQLSGQG
ncbi:MAG: hypothetical protein JNK74_16875 [Candidatus Hydrogenedentes bacterium]|nr:hypothetical protein [Candidatus Hydrogenedentota bacterium]